MDHEKGAVPLIRLVEAVGKAGIDRKIVVRIRIHQLGRDCIEPFRRLTIALMKLGPKVARPPTDRVSLEDLEMPGGVLFPNLEFRFFLENAHKDWRMFRHFLLLQQRQQFARQLHSCLSRQLIAVFAKTSDLRQCAGKNCR